MQRKKFFLSVIMVAVVTFFSGCDNNNCDEIICDFNQFCDKGQCFCQNGYEGVNCETLSADKYIGNYLVTEFCQPNTTNGNYNVFIQYGANTNEVQISNLFNSGLSFTGSIRTDFTTNAGDYIVIQDSQGAADVNLQGYFRNSTNRIELQGTYSLGFQSYECSQFTFYKQ